MTKTSERRRAGLGVGLGLVVGAVAAAGVAWAADGSFQLYPNRQPGNLTLTAVSSGVKISAQTQGKFDTRLECPEGYRVEKLGSKVYPLTRRIVREVVPGGLIPAGSAPEFHSACKGGHAAVDTTAFLFDAKCKKVKVTFFVPSLPFIPDVAGQYDLSCENISTSQPAKRALRLYWSGPRGDNFTATTAAGYGAAQSAGYAYARIEGQVFANKAAGLVPLKLYWSDSRQDNMSVVTAAGEAAATAAGYKYVRVQGYVYPANVSPVPKGTLPLELYWHSGRGDNISVAHPATKASVGSYTRVRLQGYVLKVPKASELDSNGRFK